jgi:hypothetical protein
MSGTLEKLLLQNRVTTDDLQKKSAAWFERHVNEFRNARNLPEETLLRGAPYLKKNVIIPGEMYLYIYDAKHAETLPYFDKFPLVFPFRAVPGGFYGINLHYLPYQLRARLMDRLIDHANDPGLTDNTRLRLKWQTITGFSQLKPAQVCVKHYLYSQVRSQFRKINPSDWASAVLLPMERFEGASNSTVWADSIRKIKGL